jgi:hypothetical protein
MDTGLSDLFVFFVPFVVKKAWKVRQAPRAISVYSSPFDIETRRELPLRVPGSVDFGSRTGFSRTTPPSEHRFCVRTGTNLSIAVRVISGPHGALAIKAPSPERSSGCSPSLMTP